MTIRALNDESIQGFDIALFSAGATTSRAWAQKFVDAGAVVVDNSSAFRRDPEIPLVVSEVNPEALDGHRGLIANPNCSTMQLMVALKPIYDAAGIDRLNVSTYQSVSGTGVAAVKALEAETAAALAGDPLPDPAIYPHHIAFNVLGGAGNFPEGDDHTDEERKMMFETRKILGDESIKIAVTCARVPVRNSHSESVTLETRDALSVEEARRLMEAMPGLIVVDDPATHGYPTALSAAGRDEVFVGRLRRDPTARARPADVGRQRQPAQGRGDERGADRRGSARAWARAGFNSGLAWYHICQADFVAGRNGVRTMTGRAGRPALCHFG